MQRETAGSGSAGRVFLIVGTTAVLTLVLVVLRSPADVLGAVMRSASEDAPTAGATPDVPVARVPTDATAAADRAGGTDGGPPAGDAGDAASDQGRWGVPPPRPTAGAVVEELRGTWRVEPGIEEAVALAVVAAHHWAVESASGPGARRGDGVIVTVEAVERPGAHHGVITLLVAVDDDLHRVAQPVRLDTGAPALAGRPWQLPAPDLRTAELSGSTIDDTDLMAAAERALTNAGMPGERLASLEVTGGWPFIARLDDADDVWLRWHVDRFVVTGLPLNLAGGG